jgi:hypothetical protein
MAAQCPDHRCGAGPGEPCLPLDSPSAADEAALDVECPRCGAAPTHRCIDMCMNPRLTFHTKRLHKERQRAVRDVPTVTVRLTPLQLAARAPRIIICAPCAEPFDPPPNGRPATYCSTYCRTKAWRMLNPARSKRQPWRFKTKSLGA